MSNIIYGYARISTPKQSIDRQIRNISSAFKDAIIIKEAQTGTKIQGRKELEKILSKVKEGDTIVFDSVSRMSRDAEEGVKLYLDLYDKGINLVFLKESYINTDTYKSALSHTIPLINDDVDDILIGVNNYLKKLAKKQIIIAFEQSEKEVQDLKQRTKEGIETARRAGKQIGQETGRKLNVKKSYPAKETILKHSKDFYGTLNDKECMKLSEVSRNTYYKYKKELEEQLNNN